jgi:hypothetical protein
MEFKKRGNGSEAFIRFTLGSGNSTASKAISTTLKVKIFSSFD